MMVDNDTDPVLFYRAIIHSHSFFTENRKYLFALLSSHSIWQDYNRWSNAVSCVVSSRVIAEKESFRRI